MVQLLTHIKTKQKMSEEQIQRCFQKYNVDPNWDVPGNNWLMTAMTKGNGTIDLIRELIQCGADVHARSSDKKTCLFYTENIDILKLFIVNGVDVNATAESGQHALLELMRDDHDRSSEDTTLIPFIQFMLGAGANPNLPNEDGNTCMHFVKSVKEVELLIQYDANIHHKNKEGYSPLHSAMEWAHNDEVVQYLVQTGADPTEIGPNNESYLDWEANRLGEILRQEANLRYMWYEDDDEAMTDSDECDFYVDETENAAGAA